MGRIRDNAIRRFGRRRSLRYWRAAAEAAAQMAPERLREAARQAHGLRRLLDRVLVVAEARLAPPRPAIGGLASLESGADWVWRPEVMRARLTPPGRIRVANDTGFGNGLKIFHDSAAAEISLLQRPAPGGFDLLLEVYRFDGSFLSLVVDVPPEGVQGLTHGSVLGVSAVLTLERPLEIYARLNLRAGPNTESQVAQVQPDGQGRVAAEFDLAQAGIDPSMTVEAAWVDLIVDAPDMNAIRLTDLALARRAGAQF